MVTSLRYENFRALEKYRISLSQFNVLVGPNNSGKSTILDGLRLLDGAYRFASRRKPQFLCLEDGTYQWGWAISPASLTVDIENVHTDYSDASSSITYHVARGRSLRLIFPRTGSPTLVMQTDGRIPKSPASVRELFPVSLAVVPTLGPLEREEVVLQSQYVMRSTRGHLAPRHFRNLWYHDKEGFSEFKKLLESTWEDASIQPPELPYLSTNTLAMFMTEKRMTREVAWAGFGFQVWIQLLTHIVKSRGADLLVVDEPEIYLHPDLQRSIVGVLRRLGPRVVLATHSVEIINEVEPSEIITVERNKSEGKRLTDLRGLEHAAQLLGSSQNTYLTRLARERRILFVEGKDKKLLQRFAAKTGHADMFDTGRLATIPVEGFSGQSRVKNAQWAFSNVLGEGMRVAALFDRDYRCDEEINELQTELRLCTDYVHILEKKEIENYLLVPDLIDRCISARLQIRVEHGGLATIPEYSVMELLDEATGPMRPMVKSQLGARKLEYHRWAHRDGSTYLLEIERTLDEEWQSIDKRMRWVPGKEVIAAINTICDERWGVSITVPQLANAIKVSEIDAEIQTFFADLQNAIFID